MNGLQRKRKIKNGQDYFIAYIDPSLSNEGTYEYKDKIKSFGARFDGQKKTWYFILSNDAQKRNWQIEQFLKPCVEFLKSVEKTPSKYPQTDAQIQEILTAIDKLINKIQTSSTTEVDTNFDAQDIKDRLIAFKEELLNSFKDESWKKKFEPLIKFKQALGPRFSMTNTILIYIQDPEATMVKSTSNWRNANRKIKSGAPAIALWMPHGDKKFKTQWQKHVGKVDWLIQNGKLRQIDPNSISYKQIDSLVAKLSIGEKETLNKYLNQFNGPVTHTLEPLWYDYRFTEQIPGTEDLIGSPNNEDIEWFDGTSQETDKTSRLYDAVINAIKSTQINLVYGTEQTLGGARGVSKSGEIEVLQGIPKNAGAISTLVHEFSHELLHQKWLSNSSQDFAKYFVGTEQGRALVEQQAEISAWIVMRNFGYSMQTAVNYVGCWGGDERNVIKVFDTVANVASYIINSVQEQLSNMNESMQNTVNLSGMDVAQMLGQEAVSEYQKSLQLNQKLTEIKNKFFDFLNRMSK